HAPETLASRIHADRAVSPAGGLGVRDAGSKHGTFLNEERVTTAVPVRLGDRITLGPGGPVLIVAGLGTAPEMPVARRMGLIARALAWARADSRRKLGWLLVILLALMLLLAGAQSSVYRLVSPQVEQP